MASLANATPDSMEMAHFAAILTSVALMARTIVMLELSAEIASEVTLALVLLATKETGILYSEFLHSLEQKMCPRDMSEL